MIKIVSKCDIFTIQNCKEIYIKLNRKLRLFVSTKKFISLCFIKNKHHTRISLKIEFISFKKILGNIKQYTLIKTPAKNHKNPTKPIQKTKRSNHKNKHPNDRDYLRFAQSVGHYTSAPNRTHLKYPFSAENNPRSI